MVHVVNPIEHIRKRKLMYLGREDVLPECLIANVVSDALTLGVREIWVRHYGSWLVMGSSEDWLQYENFGSVVDPFYKILPLPGGPPEAFRREILLTAFADSLFIKKGDEVVEIVGKAPVMDDWFTGLPNDHRVLAFKILEPKIMRKTDE